MKKKLLLLVCLIVAVTVVFTGCTGNVRLSDVYVNHATLTEFDGANKEGEIPQGYSVGYGVVKNPFFTNRPWVVVKNDNTKDNTKGAIYAVYDYQNGEWVLGLKDGKEILVNHIVKTDEFIFYMELPSSSVKAIACGTRKEISFKKDTTAIGGVITFGDDSKFFAYKNNSMLEIYGLDGYLTQTYYLSGNTYVYDDYLMMTDRVSNAGKVAFYKLPSVKDSNTEVITKPQKEYEGSNVYVSYLGNGKFYIFNQTDATKNDYQYEFGGKYYNGEAIIYNVSTKTEEKRGKSNTYFISILFDENEQITNQFGDLVVSINDVIKKGYKLVQSGLTVDTNTKKAYSDQYILNKDNEVVTSLTGRVGKNFQLNQDRLGDMSPLYMLFIDGKGFSPNNSWSYIRLLNIDGSTAFEKTDATYKNLFYNDGILVCQKLVTSTKTLYDNARFGAYDRNGRTIVGFDYDYIAPFISGVALAYNLYFEDYPDVRVSDIYSENGKWHKPNGEVMMDKKDSTKNFDPKNAKKTYKVYKLDKNGNATVIDDFTTTKNSQLIFKTGAYVCKNIDGTYNVKTISGTRLFNDDFKQVVINKPNLDDVTICGTLKDGKTVIYTLTSSTRGLPRATTVHDIVVPVVIVASLTIASIVMIFVIKSKTPMPINKTEKKTAGNVSKKGKKK